MTMSTMYLDIHVSSGFFLIFFVHPVYPDYANNLIKKNSHLDFFLKTSQSNYGKENWAEIIFG